MKVRFLVSCGANGLNWQTGDKADLPDELARHWIDLGKAEATMQVKLIGAMASPKGAYAAGTTLDLPEAEAKELIAGGYAEAVPQPPAPPPPAEVAQQPPGFTPPVVEKPVEQPVPEPTAPESSERTDQPIKKARTGK